MVIGASVAGLLAAAVRREAAFVNSAGRAVRGGMTGRPHPFRVPVVFPVFTETLLQNECG